MSLRVLVQAGHLAPREPGIPGLGAAGEVELNTKIRDALVKLTAGDDRFDAIPAPGNLPDGIEVDAALFLHCDGGPASARGFSFGFPGGARHKALADHIRAEFLKLPEGHPNGDRPDNNTPDEAHYYGFNHGRVITRSMCLVEHGFVSNPSEHKWLKAHVGDLAHAEYVGLCRHFGLRPAAGDDDRHPTLRKGMTPNREAVTRLQRLLRAAHVARTPLNGRYDFATRLAVKRFQREHGIAPDLLATVDQRTWNALETPGDPR
jgi:hypothetical protein